MLSFIKPNTVSTSVQQTPIIELSPVISTCTLRRKLRDVSVDTFADCMSEDNYTGLVIEGNATPGQLEHAWVDLFYDFVELIDEANTKHLLKLQRRIMELGNRINEIRLMCDFMAVAVRHKEHVSDSNWETIVTYIKELRSMGYRYKFDISNEKSISRDLQGIRSRCIKLEIDLEILKIELQSVEASMKKGSKPDRSYFINTLRRVSEWMHSHLDAKLVNMEDFCYYKRDYYRHLDQIAAQNNKGGKNAGR